MIYLGVILLVCNILSCLYGIYQKSNTLMVAINAFVSGCILTGLIYKVCL